jgi:HEAT repeat protein
MPAGVFGAAQDTAVPRHQVDVASPNYGAAAGRAIEVMSSPQVEWPRPVSRPVPQALSSAAAPSARPVLVETARADDPITRVRALEGLAQTGDLGYVDTFIGALSDPAPEVRETASRILAQVNPDVVFEKVMAVLCGDNPDMAARVDAVLPSLRDALEGKMVGALEFPGEPEVRKKVAAYCLGRMRCTPAIPLLARSAWGADPEVALASVNALQAMQDPVAGPRFVELVGHPVAEVRWAALQGLANLGGLEAIAALGRVAAGPPPDDEALGKQAAILLGTMKTEAVIPFLIEAMRRNLAVRRAAVEALHRITGEDLGDLPSDWDQWYQRKQREARNPVPPGSQRPPPWQVEFLPE